MVGTVIDTWANTNIVWESNPDLVEFLYKLIVQTKKEQVVVLLVICVWIFGLVKNNPSGNLMETKTSEITTVVVDKKTSTSSFTSQLIMYHYFSIIHTTKS